MHSSPAAPRGPPRFSSLPSTLRCSGWREDRGAIFVLVRGRESLVRTAQCRRTSHAHILRCEDAAIEARRCTSQAPTPRSRSARAGPTQESATSATMKPGVEGNGSGSAIPEADSPLLSVKRQSSDVKPVPETPRRGVVPRGGARYSKHAVPVAPKANDALRAKVMTLNGRTQQTDAPLALR